MSLNLKLKELIALKEQRDAARERWTALLSQSDEGHFEARREHLRLDDAYEGKVQELVTLLTSLNQDDSLEDELGTVPSSDKRVLEHLLSDRGLVHLIEETQDSAPQCRSPAGGSRRFRRRHCRRDRTLPRARGVRPSRRSLAPTPRVHT
jgi:hypothetical protein